MRQPIALALLCAAVADTATKPHTLVIYAYSQHSAEAVANVRYFLRFGLSNATDATFVFVVNGCHSVKFPKQRANVLVVERPNTCFDFGAWGVGLEAAEAAGVAYDFVVLLNGSVRGPFLPAYERRPWWRVFTDGLSVADAPGLLGTTANCADLDASDARSAHVQSMVLAMTRTTLDRVGRRFLQSCPADKAGAIYDGELPLSRAVLDAGLELGALLLAHGPRGTTIPPHPPADLLASCAAVRENSELGLGDVYFPALGGDALDVHPLEVVFYKTARSGAGRATLDRLTHWAYFHAAGGALRDPAARRRDFSADALVGDDCDETHWPVADADGAASPAARDAAHLVALEGALRGANDELARLRAENAALRDRAVYV